jgi:DNA polymerase-3 subunit alpha
METIPDFIRRKHGQEAVTYLDPRMKDYLQASYGLLVYQDDVLLTAINLAGYDWLEVDKFRKAMGKKIPEEMAKQEAKFKQGAASFGKLTPTMADKLWDLFKPFAAYGFNKAHAASYAVVAYQTAYMKANFPAEYMTALMSAESHDLDTVASAVRECKAMGIEVLPPDVGESEADFTYVDDQHIRFGLGTIKNLGDDTVRSVSDERLAHGPFKNLEDFATRVAGKAFNKKSLEALAKSGAFGTLAERKSVLENIDLLLAYNKNAQRERNSGQTNLFAVPGGTEETHAKLTLRQVPSADLHDVLSWEKELLGLYVTAHPFAELAKEFGDLLEPIATAIQKGEKAPVRVGGNLKTVKKITTKKGDPMLFVQLEDLSGECEVIVFPRTLAENQAVWTEGTNVAVTGRMSLKDDERKIIADKGWPLTDETKEMYKKHFRGEAVSADDLIAAKPKPPAGPGEVHVMVPDRMSLTTTDALKAAFAKYPGNIKVCLQVKSDAGTKRIETSFRLDPTPDALRGIEAIIGFGNVKVVG